MMRAFSPNISFIRALRNRARPIMRARNIITLGDYHHPTS